MSTAPPQGISAAEMRRLAGLIDARRLDLIILPTEKCNFRCTYCYEDFAIGRMRRETIEAVKELIRRRAGELDTLYLSWFGGEPLLAKEVVLEVSGYAAALARALPSLTYVGGMTTNGYLLDPATFAALAEVGVLHYQISLDGPREVHNRTRVKAGGGGTFDDIWRNLVAIRESDYPAQVMLRVHFGPDTLSEMGALLDQIRREFLHDPRFTVFLKDIVRLGGPNDHNIKMMSPEEKRLALEGLKARLYAGAPAPPEEEHDVCYASRPNSLVIRADGRVGKCTVALDDARNVIGTLRPDGTLALNQRRIHPWLRGLTNMDAETLACPLVGLPAE